MDIFPTLLSLAGVIPPSDRRYDGIDATNILLYGEQTGHEVLTGFCCQSYFGFNCVFIFVCYHWGCALMQSLDLFFFCSFFSILTVVLQGGLATCRQFEQGNTKLST